VLLKIEESLWSTRY